MNRLDQAIKLAVDAHEGQLDKAGKPYIEHPKAVAAWIQQKYAGQHWPYREFTLEDLVIAAWLHDVVEDTSVTLEDIEREFGLSVRVIVQGVTRLNTAPGQKETYRTFIKRAKQHPGSRMLKLADLHHNLSRIDQLPPEEQSIRRRYEKAVAELNRD